jgi:hypothetical protein
MRQMKRHPWYMGRRMPGAATIIGFALGAAVSVVAAFNPPRDFSFSFLLILLLTIGPCSAIAGYMLWFLTESLLAERAVKITRFVACPPMFLLLAAFPRYWLTRPHLALMSLGFIFAAAMFAVVFGFGLVHFATVLAWWLRRSMKPAPAAPSAGLWDRDLDLG